MIHVQAAAAVVEDLATAEVAAVDGEAVAATGAVPPEPAVSILNCYCRWYYNECFVECRWHYNECFVGGITMSAL